MPRDVVKTIRGRAYRYRVESYRDPATGKTRGRWTYLGKVAADDGAETVAGTRRDAGKTRAALLDATERLLGVIDLGKLTAAGIATEAGLGHGTFYRHFRNKGEAVRTAIERYRAGVDRERPSFEEPLGLRPTERARVRTWVESILRTPAERPGFARAWYMASLDDPAMRDQRRARRAEAVEALAGYFERLTAAGLAEIARPRELARALFATFDGVIRLVVADRKTVDGELRAGTVDLVERAIFSRADERADR